jgi:squalene synthase HpnD
MSAVATAKVDGSSAKRRAAGSSFYAAMRILRRDQRRAIFEIYSFCRAVDDIADARGPTKAQLAELARWRIDIEDLFAGNVATCVRGLAEAVREFDLQKPDLLAIIDGMEMDVATQIRAPETQTLELYCDRVASAVGRLCVRVFGLELNAGIALAYHLGRALQLTNILRDLDEDAALGRLYLPREALEAAGITHCDPTLVLSDPALERACSRLVERAASHFRTADAIMRGCPRRRVRAAKIMGAAYKALLAKLNKRGWSPPRAPVRLSRPRLVLTVLRHALL